MKPKLSLLARMWQRVTAYANQSTIHGEYIFHAFNLEPVSGPNLLAFKNFPGVSYLLSGHLLGRIFWMTAVLASATGNWL